MAGGQSGRGPCALPSHIRAMSCQLCHLAKGLAACTAHWPNGVCADWIIACVSVRFWYVANPGKIRCLSMGKLNKLDRDSLVMRWRIVSCFLACGS